MREIHLDQSANLNADRIDNQNAHIIKGPTLVLLKYITQIRCQTEMKQERKKQKKKRRNSDRNKPKSRQ